MKHASRRPHGSAVRRNPTPVHRGLPGFIAATCLMTAAAGPAQALDLVRTASGNWYNALAWNPLVVPNDAAHQAFIEGPAALGYSVLLSGSATVGQARVGAGNALTIGDGGSLTVAGGGITNAGVLNVLGGLSSHNRLYFASAATLSGGGITTLSTSSYGYSGMLLPSSGGTLTIASGHTVSGSGYIGSSSYGTLPVVNRGTVAATGDLVSPLYISPGSGRSFDNTAGTVELWPHSLLNLESGSLQGGNITVMYGGEASVTGSGRYTGVSFNGNLMFRNAELADSTLTGTSSLLPGSALYAYGSLVNAGTLTLTGGPVGTGFTRLYFSSPTVLSGGGTTVLARNGSGYTGMLLGSSSGTLTIASGHTVRGTGYIGDYSYGSLPVVNQGSVIAEGGILDLGPGSGKTFDNTSGTIQVASNATLRLNSGTLSGGSISGSGTVGGSATYAGVTFSGPLSFRDGAMLSGSTITGLSSVDQNSSIYAESALSVTGTLTLTGGPVGTGFTRLYFSSPTVLSGGGSTVLARASSGYTGMLLSSSSGTLTIASGHTVRGAGAIGDYDYGYGSLPVVNQGTVIAEGGILDLGPGAGKAFDNTSGTIQIASDATLRLNSGTLLLGDASTLQFDIDTAANGGALAGLFSLSGSFTADGSLLLDLSDHAASVGERFKLVTFSGTASGQFDQIVAAGYLLTAHYNAHDITVEVSGISPVPEPSAWLLLGGGLVPLAWRTRRRRLPAAALAGGLALAAPLAWATPRPDMGTWTSTLHARDLDGHAVPLADPSAVFFYDSTLNITWLRNATANSGSANWAIQAQFVSDLVVGAWSDWRMPRAFDSGAPGCDFSHAGGTDCGYNVQLTAGGITNEMAHLYYVTLGNPAAYAPGTGGFVGGSPGVTYGLVNTATFSGSFSDLTGAYSGLLGPAPSTDAWYFRFSDGLFTLGGSGIQTVLPVRDGDVLAAAVVPEPAVWQLWLGALALWAVRRRWISARSA